ncbi:hypothetical protein ACFSJU_06030 [Paradesertivirga mongoliensis]|uniref:Uncharacterized protein n=1 Tax=Paradesertivirga mongoliensis TaxID=2100740 RepID=A0ABW4ZJ81_9SPHI|nr:hypothetical protein [Pedobacter mongoliensis]
MKTQPSILNLMVRKARSAFAWASGGLEGTAGLHLPQRREMLFKKIQFGLLI